MCIGFLWEGMIMKEKYTNSEINEMLENLEQITYINSEKTIEYGLKVHSFCVDKVNEKGMAFTLLCIGRAFLNISKYEKATMYLFDSIKLSQKNNICDLQILAYINLGNIYFDIEKYEKSLDYYNFAEKIAKTFNKGENHYKNRCVES